MINIDPTITSAVISSVFSIVTTLIVRNYSKKNIAITEEAENKRITAQIDANLIWNSRIEWIQNVRQVTAQFISTCYKYLRFIEVEDESNQCLDLLLQNRELLILYFGPDNIPYSNSNKSESEIFNKPDIFDIMTNKGKNEEIVLRIHDLVEQLVNYKNYSVEYKSALQKIKECTLCELQGKIDRCDSNSYGDKITDQQCQRRISEYKKIEKNYKILRDKVYSSISDLSKIMRIYLKIEWKNAKEWNNKDDKDTDNIAE